jgi:hypothetical protein
MASSGANLEPKKRQQKIKTVFTVSSSGSFLGSDVVVGEDGPTHTSAREDTALETTHEETSKTEVASATASTETCTQLKNIQYKSMLMNGKNLAMLSEGGSSPLVTKTAELGMVHSLLTT